MRTGRILLVVLVALAGLACSRSDEQTTPEASDPAASNPAASDPAATRARCNAEVMERCAEFQRAEQLECVRREVEQCLLDSCEAP
ncbi:MAG: hypothetical protein JRG95_02810 [Deltaproteobacteria bacterium]|nr:hypothetical protein [Deltaproteobacteria bacterium]